MNRKQLFLIFISIIWVGCATKQINQVSFEKYISTLPVHMSDKITFYKDVSYDSSQATVFDLFIPKASKNTPLVIFIHGGGFTGGDKTDVYNRGKFSDEIIALTSKGIAYATINYRLLGSSDAKNVLSCMNDAKKCLQFIRYHAKHFNIDESRIGLYGGSAGAGTSLWLGMTEDMKDDKSKCPLERKSTRVKAVAAYATQASYDLSKWDDIFSDYSMTDDEVAKIISHQKIAGFYGVATINDIETKEMVTMRKNLDLGALISADDPPLWIQNPLKTDQKPSNLNEVYHHYKHGEYLYNLSEKAGIKVHSKLPAKPFQSENWIELVPFFIKYL